MKEPCTTTCVYLPAVSYSEIYWDFGGDLGGVVGHERREGYVCPVCGSQAKDIVWSRGFHQPYYVCKGDVLPGKWIVASGHRHVPMDAIVEGYRSMPTNGFIPNLNVGWNTETQDVLLDCFTCVSVLQGVLTLWKNIGKAGCFADAKKMATDWYHANNYGIMFNTSSHAEDQQL